MKVTMYSHNNDIYKAAVGWACGLGGENKECIQNFGEEVSWNNMK
jgi:hypothetical protein